MFAADSPFFAQARLAVRMLRIVAEESTLALKGGTAINLFYRNQPRLSVDLDLTYLPVEPREASLRAISAALERIARAAEARLPRMRAHTGGAADGKLVAQQDRTTVTIEVNPVLRGSVFGAGRIDAQPQVEELFGDVAAHVLAFEDVYGGKLVAALDRQHPRDLFDVKLLLETEGITERLLDAFVVYLASHGRPIAEVLRSRNKDLQTVFEREFAAMTRDPVTLDVLLTARDRMIVELRRSLLPRHKAFLLGIKRIEPQWDLVPFPHIRELPAIQWKLQNLEKWKTDQPRRYGAAVAELEHVLENFGS
jgi:hypothetical protein